MKLTVKKMSQKQENKVAKDLKAKTVVASGALWGAKGDVRNDKFLVECKTTEKAYYTLTKKVWCKIRSEAINDGLRIPLMCVEIQGRAYAVIEKSMIEEHLTKHQIEPIISVVSSKSFRVKDLIETEFIEFKTQWVDRLKIELVQMSWDSFLSIVEEYYE